MTTAAASVVARITARLKPDHEDCHKRTIIRQEAKRAGVTVDDVVAALVLEAYKAGRVSGLVIRRCDSCPGSVELHNPGERCSGCLRERMGLSRKPR